MIPFNKPYKSGKEINYIIKAQKNNKISDKGEFYYKCINLLKKQLKAKYILLTNSCTSALEVSALILDIKPGDEVIIPSFSYVSTANAFVKFGATPVFVDINKNNLCIDVKLIEKKITPKTKAIVAVNYAGLSCNYEKLIKICKKNKIKLIEDAAQSYLAEFKKKKLGTLGDFGCLSFHETKNITCGNGGALILKNKKDYIKASYVIDKGTNKKDYINGKIKKYEWVSKGSSYACSEINSAYLFAQLQKGEWVTLYRKNIWEKYNAFFKKNYRSKIITRPLIEKYNNNNGHIYYILLKNKIYRDQFIRSCKKLGVETSFHYLPLHQSKMIRSIKGKKNDLKNSINISNRIVRLPLWVGLDKDLKIIMKVIRKVLSQKIFNCNI